MIPTSHLIASAMLVALGLGADGQVSLAATAAGPDVEATGVVGSEAEAEAQTEPAPSKEEAKKEKKPGRWAETGRPPGKEISNRWGFWVGTYGTDITTDAAIGSGNVLGTQIRVEDDLGLGADDQTLRIQGFYRFNPRHGLDLGYWGLSRTGSQVIDEEIKFQDKIFSVGADIETDLRTSWYRVAYKYSMVNNRRAEAGITAGFSSYKFKLSLAGDASFTDPNGVITPAEFDTLTESVFAPVPTFGFFLTYAMRPRLLFKLKADLLDLTVSDFEGSLLDTSVGVEWFFSEHAGVGLMSNTMNIEVKNTGDSPWTVDYKQRGWVGYFTFVFGSNQDKDKRQPG